ncbi:TPA: excinuclease ABC subunit UvrC [Candidatus Peregrinibacteria bacterium]|nr:excinuclease ABC subunit UvrC [Candidatus Peregrinibacteria bacterium]
MSDSFDLSTILEQLPKEPGVYEMRDENNEILYIGKAKNLSSRVRSYFRESANHSLRIQKLVEKIKNIEWTTTRNEAEALILEDNLIKQKRPRFNILLRDDKTYSYIKITNEDFPRIILVRKVVKDGAKYFGPKTSGSAVRKIIDMLNDIFLFKTSSIGITENTETGEVLLDSGNQKIPCLNYHLKKCHAPCLGKISKYEYTKIVQKALSFLRGETKEITEFLTEKMMNYAQNSKFTLAAKTRDIIKSIENISEKQIISAPNELSADIIGLFTNYGHVFFHVFSARNGKIINSQTFPVMIKNESSLSPVSFLVQQEALNAFLASHANRVSDFPKTIILDKIFIDEDEKQVWEQYFTTELNILNGVKVEISLPEKARRKELLDLAHQNAEDYARRHAMSFIKKDENYEETLETLQKQLGMKSVPKRMECYDISHYSGEKTVASMVVFENGKEKKSDYRSFNITSINTETGIDDFKSLAEALTRRLSRLPEKFPENWLTEKIKRKQDIQAMQNFPCLGGVAKIYITKNTIKKLSTADIYGLFNSEKPKKIYTDILGLVEINSMKHAKISLSEMYIAKNMSEATIGEIQMYQKKMRKFLLDIFIKTKCDVYKIFHYAKKTQEYLEHLGFEEKITEDGELYMVKIGKLSLSLSDSFVKVPELIIIDGGKGQLSSTWNILKNTDYADKIQICSLAKREEEVFAIRYNPEIKMGEMYKTEIQKNSNEGHMLQRIRNEAHRFAITKNRAGREKVLQKSVLDEIQGIGGKTKKVLKQKFGGIVGIRDATDQELLEFVSEKVLKRIRENI